MTLLDSPLGSKQNILGPITEFVDKDLDQIKELVEKAVEEMAGEEEITTE